MAREVAEPYRALHLFPTAPPPGVDFYSGAWRRTYTPDRERAADAILAQALEGIDYPAVIDSAYGDGVRLFLEMGPGGSCSRMIGRILAGRPHLARPVTPPGQDPASALLRLLAHLASERVPLDLSPLYAAPPVTVAPSADKSSDPGDSRRRAVYAAGFPNTYELCANSPSLGGRG